MEYESIGDADGPKRAAVGLLSKRMRSPARQPQGCDVFEPDNGLRTELEDMKRPGLKARCKEVCVALADLGAIDDATDPKEAAIRLLLGRAHPHRLLEDTKQEFFGEKLSGLKMRCVAAWGKRRWHRANR